MSDPVYLPLDTVRAQLINLAAQLLSKRGMPSEYRADHPKMADRTWQHVEGQAMRANEQLRQWAVEIIKLATLMPVSSEIFALREENARLRAGLRDVANCIDNLECDCLDPPEDRGEDPDEPGNHSDYCSHYLMPYIQRLLDCGLASTNVGPKGNL